MFIKLAYGLQIHLYSGRLSLSAIRNHAETVFKKLPNQYVLCYMSQQGKKIIITSEQDLSGLKCGILKMMICDFDEGLLSLDSESSFSEFDEFVGNQQDEQCLSIPSQCEKIDEVQSEKLRTQNSRKVNLDQYIECSFNSQNEPQQDNILTSINQNFGDYLTQEVSQKATAQEERSLLQNCSKKYLQTLQQEVANTIISQQVQLFKRLSKDFVSGIGEKRIAKAVKQTQKKKIIGAEEDNFTFQFNGAFNEFLDKLFATATQKLLAEKFKKKIQKMKKDRNIIQHIPKIHTEKKKARSLGHNQLSNKNKPKPVKSIKIKKTPIERLNLSSQTANAKQVSENINIDAIVEKKLKSMLPQIIMRVTQIVEQSISKANCIKCQRSGLEVEKLMSKQLLTIQSVKKAKDL